MTLPLPDDVVVVTAKDIFHYCAVSFTAGTVFGVVFCYWLLGKARAEKSTAEKEKR